MRAAIGSGGLAKKTISLRTKGGEKGFRRQVKKIDEVKEKKKWEGKGDAS